MFRSSEASVFPLQIFVGEMAEWLKAHAWKACLLERVTWVRIPLSPPYSRTAAANQCKSRCLRDGRAKHFLRPVRPKVLHRWGSAPLLRAIDPRILPLIISRPLNQHRSAPAATCDL